MEQREISMLYIDDASVVAYLHKHNYKKMGIQTYFAKGLSSSIETLKAHKIHVIVVNINSLTIDTAELTKSLSLLERASKIPIIATGISSSAKTKKAYMEGGASLFIEQPLPLTIFAGKIIGVLGYKTRLSKRIEQDFLGSVFCYEENTLIECEICDLSEGGVKIKSPRELSLSKGSFKIYLKGRKKPVELLGELKIFSQKNAKEEQSRFYRLIFLKIADDDLIYLKNLVSEDPSEKRVSYYYE